MSLTTPLHALRYPASTDPADVPTDMLKLATDVDNALPPAVVNGQWIKGVGGAMVFSPIVASSSLSVSGANTDLASPSNPITHISISTGGGSIRSLGIPADGAGSRVVLYNVSGTDVTLLGLTAGGTGAQLSNDLLGSGGAVNATLTGSPRSVAEYVYGTGGTWKLMDISVVAPSNISGYPANVAQVLRGDGTWGTVANAQIAAAAAIAYSKLALTGAILNADLAGSIAASKISGYPSNTTTFLRGDGSWVAATPPTKAFYTSNPTNPTGTTSVAPTRVMCGLALPLTPVVTGNVVVIITGNAGVTVSNSRTGSYTLRRGTGTAPTNGAAETGTAMTPVTNVQSIVNQTNNNLPVAIVAGVSGLATGTAVWFDLSQAVDNSAGTFAFTNLSVVIAEVG